MNNPTNAASHWGFWLICLIGLLWNVGGSINYLMQMDQEFVKTLPETHQAIITDRPLWATGGFAVGVFGGALGCLLLLLKKSFSFYLFIASFVGIVITMIHTIIVSQTKITFAPSEFFVMIVMPLIVATFLIWYSKLLNQNL